MIDPTELVVSMPYKERWMEIMELWFLGMQTMAGVLQVVPWLSQFTLESGWAEEIIEMLKKVKIGSLQPNVKSAFEDRSEHCFCFKEMWGFNCMQKSSYDGTWKISFWRLKAIRRAFILLFF